MFLQNIPRCTKFRSFRMKDIKISTRVSKDSLRLRVTVHFTILWLVHGWKSINTISTFPYSYSCNFAYANFHPGIQNHYLSFALHRVGICLTSPTILCIVLTPTHASRAPLMRTSPLHGFFLAFCGIPFCSNRQQLRC